MAFGGGGNTFSFGNNNNQNSGFGSGFGNNTNSGGFGSNNNASGFGASTTGTNPFGASTSTFGNNNNTTSAFGSNNAGNSLFGNKTTSAPFGTSTASTGGSLFGGTNNTTGGFGTGAFGGNTSNTGFGANSNTTGNAFSFGSTANKPAFGSTASSTPLFGQGGAGTTGFGATSTGFGASGTALNGPIPPSDGTASTPFAPFNDKEQNGTQNSYQSITFQPPYEKYSFEELRLGDYNAGRRFGNGSGQAGAFGNPSFSGGFGTSNTGTAFGANNNTNPFGAATTSSGAFGSNTTTSGFGGNTGSSLFGNTQNKPAGGLFGSQTTSSGTTGGLFGTANSNSGGFGTANSGGFGSNTNTGGSLFGNNQNKPAGGLFGGTSNQTGTTSLFGNNNNQTATNTGGGLFGNNNNSTTTGGGLFGNNQQTSTGGLFGNNQQQQKPGGLFGSTGGFGTATQNQTTGSLFGSNNNATSNTGGGLFGNNNSTNTGGGLFGNSASTNTGGGLFGNANQTNNTGGGLFGNTAQNQAKPGGLFGTANTGGGLFGNNNNTTTNTGGLFGNTTANSGGLFGNANANKPTGSLFGNTTTNQTGGGLFGTSTGSNTFGLSQNNQQQNQQQQDGVRHASLLDPNPYGQSSIWTGLPAASPENSKPVFTPLTASQKLKESMMKPPPSLRLNQSRYMTPPRRNGFGFTYSTYGTPNSAASTPGGAGLSGSMYGSRGWSGGSFGRSFNKSASVQNLRAQFSSDNDELWKPGAFTSSGRHSSGSIKRLTIDRSIRNDLFSRPTQAALPAPPAEKSTSSTPASSNGDLNGEPSSDNSNKFKKRVSFDNSTTGGQLNGQTGALVRTESPDQDDEPSPPTVNAEAPSRNNELAAVPEDRESDHVSTRSEGHARVDPQPGDYWMKPSRAEMAKLPREKLQKFRDFQVGRRGCGQVTFNGTVDLTALPLDELYDKIVEIRLRSVTVYPDASSKPPVGKGLNVPSTIAIENSWPRSRNQPSSLTSGPVFDKHVNRLKKMSGTEFVDYEVDTGVWTFRVPHYTRYGLDYDDDDDADMSDLTPPPDSIAADESTMDVERDDFDHSDDDDTFAFRQTKTVPGGFGRQSYIDDNFEPASSALVPVDHDMEDDLSEHSAQPSDDDYSEDEPSMAGAFPAPVLLNFESSQKPILRAPGTPGKPLLDLDGDWADQLQQTISPRKQNRDMLRETQSKVLLDRAYSPIKPAATQQSFRNSVDVMSSIFGKFEESRMSPGSGGSAGRRGNDPTDFEIPHAKRAKTLDEGSDNFSNEEREWQSFLKARLPGFEATSLPKGHDTSDVANQNQQLAFDLTSMLSSAKIYNEDGVPKAEHQQLPFSYLLEQIDKASRTETDQQIKDIYSLAHVLFDEYEDQYSLDLPASGSERARFMPLVRKDRLTDYLSTYIFRKHGERISQIERENPTAAALLKLSMHDIKGACDSLQKAKNYKLMLLVSQLENASQAWQAEIKAQIDAWRDQGVLSEISEDVRAIYEVCAGNVTICLGKSAPGVPVEDKAKTFALSEEFGLDWIQCFAMGLWYGADEKNAAANGIVQIKDAVTEFANRCDRGEENIKPGSNIMWVLLRVHASSAGAKDVPMPVFPQALDSLKSSADASRAFALHYALTSTIEGIAIDDAQADQLSALLAWQLSLKADVAGAVFALLHLEDAASRQETVEAVLKRFASTLPEPPTNETNTTSDASSTWSILTERLSIPAPWILVAKARHARSTDPSGHLEIEYLIAAQSWDDAHECLIRRVAPGCIVDGDYDLLANFVNLFGNDADSKISDWVVGGGIYADFVRLVKSQFPAEIDEDLIASLATRLTNMGREFARGPKVDLGQLSVESLEERVAMTEMSRVVAEKLASNTAVLQKDILDLPITSDLRSRYTLAMACDHYRGVMAGGASNI